MRDLARLALLLLSLLPALALASPEGRLALVDVHVLDTRSGSLLRDQVVEIRGQRIAAVVPRSGWERQEGQVVVPGEGAYLLPGLIDAHVHLATDPERADNERDTLSRLRGLLRGGVTTVRDMGGDVRVLAGLKRRAELGLITAPDIHYSVIIGGPAFFDDRRTVSSARGRTPGQTDWMRAVTGDTDFDALVLRSLGTGATGLKAYAEMTAPQLRALAAAAARHGMPLWSHAYHREIPPSQVVEAGVDVISHAPYLAAEVVPDFHAWHRRSELPDELALAQSMDPAAYDALFAALQSRGTLLDATLAVFELSRDRDASRRAMYRHARFFTRLAGERRIPLVAGTDTASDIAGLPFAALHYELALMVEEAGISPAAALRAATLNGATALGLGADLGTVEAGKLANLLLLRDNPLERIEATRTPVHVIKRGEFVYRGSDPRLPFSDVFRGRRGIHLSGQIGNLPGTLTLAGDSIAAQTRQAMRNIGYVLEDHDLGLEDVASCTLMLADIDDWAAASEVYLEFFNPPLPARSAFAAAGLALGARVEVECQVDP